MIRKRNSLFVIGVLLSLYACKKDGAKIDTPTITSYKTTDVAYMGDSIPVSITAAGEYPLNTIKITFSRDGQRIAENIIPVSQSGTYENKLLVPFVKDIDDGPAEIQIMVKNKNFDYSTVAVPIQITRPKFPYLTLKTAYGDYKMLPVDGEPYKYAVTEAFPATKLPALIEAPAYGDNGNSFLFGGSTIEAYATGQDSIPFQKVVPLGTPFTVTFDTRSFVGEPFLIPSFGGIAFPAYTGNTTVIESDFTQNQTITIDGILDIASWWIDPTFLDNNGDGTCKFRAMTGKYRITADKVLKYFKIEPMDGDALADFDPATHSGGVYVNGGIGDLAGSAPEGRLGIPSITSNPSLWDANKNIAMAPLGNGIYQIKLIAGTTLFQSNVSGSTAGISFYQNSRLKTNPLAFTLVQSLYGSPGTPNDYAANGDGNSATIGTARFNMKPASANSVGQMITTGSNRSLGNGRTYVFTVDTKVSPAAVSISIE